MLFVTPKDVINEDCVLIRTQCSTCLHKRHQASLSLLLFVEYLYLSKEYWILEAHDVNEGRWNTVFGLEHNPRWQCHREWHRASKKKIHQSQVQKATRDGEISLSKNVLPFWVNPSRGKYKFSKLNWEKLSIFKTKLEKRIKFYFFNIIG